jgi:hypothetical protein
MMNTAALVCIAKNEDNYIDEWLDYNHAVGFDRIFVYQNDWRYPGDKSLRKWVEWVEWDGEKMQMRAYNDFIDRHCADYAFAAFFDVDEYICLFEDRNVKDFFARYSDFPAVGVNWRYFGDGGMADAAGRDYSLIRRFVRCGKTLNRHVKTVLNLTKCGNIAHFVNPHFVDVSMQYNFTVDVGKKTYIHGPFNDVFTYGKAQLNHYCSKTFGEFREKIARGKADTAKDHPMYNYTA